VEDLLDAKFVRLQAVIETWMLLEFADRGSLEQAIAARRFLRKADRSLDMVWRLHRSARTYSSY